MSQKIGSARAGIIDVIKECGGFDQEKGFVNIDKIWEKPESNRKISEHIVSFIKASYPVKDISEILSVDTLAYPYGPIPVATLVSAQLKKPFGIIKEGNDPISGRHGLFGANPTRNSLVIFDVTRFGITAMRLLMFLHEEAALPKWFLSIVDFEQEAFDFLSKTLYKEYKLICDFRAIVTLREIQNYMNVQGELNGDIFTTFER